MDLWSNFTPIVRSGKAAVLRAEILREVADGAKPAKEDNAPAAPPAAAAPPAGDPAPAPAAAPASPTKAKKKKTKPLPDAANEVRREALAQGLAACGVGPKEYATDNGPGGSGAIVAIPRKHALAEELRAVAPERKRVPAGQGGLVMEVFWTLDVDLGAENGMQALNVAVAAAAMDEAPANSLIAGQRLLMPPPADHEKVTFPNGPGRTLHVWPGFFQSVRVTQRGLCLDVDTRRGLVEVTDAGPLAAVVAKAIGAASWNQVRPPARRGPRGTPR